MLTPIHLVIYGSKLGANEIDQSRDSLTVENKKFKRDAKNYSVGIFLFIFSLFAILSFLSDRIYDRLSIIELKEK